MTTLLPLCPHGRLSPQLSVKLSSARPVGVCLAIPCHLGARRSLEDLVDVRVSAHVREAVAAEPVGQATSVRQHRL